MYRAALQGSVRSNWSEFSLRSRPSKTQRYQAGAREKVVPTQPISKHRTPQFLRSMVVVEDSIESDVYTILMSYPEGQQRLLAQIEEKKRKDKDLRPTATKLNPKHPERAFKFKRRKTRRLTVDRNKSKKSNGKKPSKGNNGVKSTMKKIVSVFSSKGLKRRMKSDEDEFSSDPDPCSEEEDADFLSAFCDSSSEDEKSGDCDELSDTNSDEIDAGFDQEKQDLEMYGKGPTKVDRYGIARNSMRNAMRMPRGNQNDMEPNMYGDMGSYVKHLPVGENASEWEKSLHRWLISCHETFRVRHLKLDIQMITRDGEESLSSEEGFPQVGTQQSERNMDVDGSSSCKGRPKQVSSHMSRRNRNKRAGDDDMDTCEAGNDDDDKVDDEVTSDDEQDSIMEKPFVADMKKATTEGGCRSDELEYQSTNSNSNGKMDADEIMENAVTCNNECKAGSLDSEESLREPGDGTHGRSVRRLLDFDKEADPVAKHNARKERNIKKYKKNEKLANMDESDDDGRVEKDSTHSKMGPDRGKAGARCSLMSLEDLDAGLHEQPFSSFLDLLNSNKGQAFDPEAETYEECVNHEGLVADVTPDSPNENTKFPYGTLVWGRYTKTVWWPGIVIRGSLVGQREAKPCHVWVMWFGDYKISQLRETLVNLFIHEFTQKCHVKMSSLHETAVVEAIQECTNRAGIDIGELERVRSWGLYDTGFTDLLEAAADISIDLFAPVIGNELPIMVVEQCTKLRRVNALLNADDKDEDTDGEVCRSCGKRHKFLVTEHPLFVGKVCSRCKDRLLETLFSYDSDGCALYCAVCACPGLMLVCEELNCGRSFCLECMQENLDTDDYNEVKQKSPWLCLLCSMYAEETHGSLIPRSDWPAKLVDFYNTRVNMGKLFWDLPVAPLQSRKLRVLSIGDGIGTLYMALQQLGIEVDKYYTCEVDHAAIAATDYLFEDRITCLGDVWQLSALKLQSICPLDLVVVSPPCHDMIVSYNKEQPIGQDNSWLKLIKIMMALKDIRLMQGKEKPLYWLLKTPTSIMSCYRKDITKVLQKCPAMWDPGWMSAYHHPCFVWGNIPGLDGASEYFREHGDEEFPLNECLVAKLNRNTQVVKLRNCAITQNPFGRNSSKQKTHDSVENDNHGSDEHFVAAADDDGHFDDDDIEENDENDCAGEDEDDLFDVFDDDEEGDDEDDESAVVMVTRSNDSQSDDKFILPVLMDGQQTHVWALEIERALGLPDHFTDVPVKSRARVKLLAQASSLTLMKRLLSPLAQLVNTLDRAADLV